MVNELVLSACTPTPLAAYLRALAVLRLVAEAGTEGGGDADACGLWRNDVFVLRTRLTCESLEEFFLERYRPTPLVAPWGARSGFYAGSSEKTAREALTEILHSTNDQLAPFRAAIRAVQALLATYGFDEKASEDKKLALLGLCRSNLPESLLPWLDACYVLTSDGRKFPPLLGTGGNEGSGSYVSGFAQQVIACVAKRAHDKALSTSLFGRSEHDISSNQMPGHFHPGASGGPNSSSSFGGPTQLNPWDYLLALEGSVLFAASTVRRLESGDSSFMVAPFTVRSRAGTAGAGNPSDDADARGEMWMPLWTAPLGIEELRCLLAEGRAALNGRHARDGLDFARAVAQLGVDRGIASFQRYGFFMRSGKSFLATPLGRVKVQRNTDADLISQLDRHGWLASVQRYARDDNAPSIFRSAARQLDMALFAMTQQSSRVALQAVLRQIGCIEAALSLSHRAQEAIRSPVPRLSHEWATLAGGRRGGDSSEFRIATALAGLKIEKDGRSILHARVHLAKVSEPWNGEGDRSWEPTSVLVTWGSGPLTRNLAALLRRRRLEVAKHGMEGEVLAGTTGATCEDVEEFLAARTDDVRIAELLHGLACVDPGLGNLPHGGLSDPALPPAFALLKVFFTSERLLRELNLDWPTEDQSVRLPAEIPARLAANDVQTAVKLAWQQLHAWGARLPGRQPPVVVGADGPRWLAALCIPLTRYEMRRLLRPLALEGDDDQVELIAQSTA